MSMARLVKFGLLGLICYASALGTARAEGPSWKSQAVALFDAGWKPGTDAHVAADDLYAAAKEAAGDDARVEYARALVLIKQRRNDAALEQLDKILKQSPGNLTAMTWKVRLRLHSKKYPAAIVDMEQLAAGAAASLASAKDAAQKTEGLAAARFLGRAYGFLEGPGELKEIQREELKTALLQHVTGDAHVAFEAGRSQVLEQFNAMVRQAEQHKTEDQEKEAQDKKVHQEQVNSQKANLEQEVADIGAERTKLRDEQRKELAEVSRELRQAETAQSQAESRLATVLRQWNFQISERDRWLVAMDAERDPARREVYRIQAAQIDATLGTIDGERRLREGDVARARADRAAADQNRVQVQRRFQSAQAALDKREDSVRKGMNRIGNEQKRIDKPVSSQSSRQRNLNARATAFVTYDEFPLDIEKARLLSALK
jgi:hypothetical protein